MTVANVSQSLLIPGYTVARKVFREELHRRDRRGRFTRKPGAGLPDLVAGTAPVVGPKPAGGMRDARRFASDEEAVTWANTALKPPELPDDEAQAVIDYTGDYYQEMNDALRDAADEGTVPDVWTQDRIDAVRDAIARSPVPESFVVFRGSPASSLEMMVGKLGGDDDGARLQRLVGRTISVPTFHSTSIGASAYFDYSPVQWMIKIPKGHPALWVEGDLTQNEGEREVLLPDNTRRVIHAAYRSPNYPEDPRLFIEVEVVGNDWQPGGDWVPQPAGDAYAGYPPLKPKRKK